MMMFEDRDPFRSAGMQLLLELLEDWANDGTLDEFHTRPDPRTGYDGICELTDSVMGMMDYEMRWEHPSNDV